MKFMKLGSKPDSFQTDGDNIRYVATELATDAVINVGDVKFYLHKFPLLSKSARLQKLVALSNDENHDEICIDNIPGGPAAFEVCAKFCYGMTVTLNAYNVVATRCAAEYLEMYETVEKGNLVYKIDVFLNSSIFRSWKDSIIVLQTTKSLLPWTEELKVVSHCLDSIASKASVDTSRVEWSYTYNRKKLPTENGNDPQWNGVRKQPMVPKDWWVEDLCDLQIDLYKRVITTIKTKGKVSGDVVGEALKAYALRRLPGFSKGMIQGGDVIKNRQLRRNGKKGGGRRIGQQLEEATVGDLFIRTPAGETTLFEIDVVQNLVEEFIKQEKDTMTDFQEEIEFQEIRSPAFVSDASKVKVAKLVDGYLAEISRDPNLLLSKFVDLHKWYQSWQDHPMMEHPGISKSERKRICKLMDCKKLSADACKHAVQNERLPMRVVVQVLFFEQVRTTTSSSSGGCTTPDLPGSLRALLPTGSHGSSRSATTNTEDDWDAIPTAEELKSLRGELATLRLSNDVAKTNAEKIAASKVKGVVMMLEEPADVNPLSFGMEEDTQSSYDFEARVLHVVVKKKILGM
ncbi:hypothetical protein C3L33_01297, partial [Rhododendron williamsianum]